MVDKTDIEKVDGQEPEKKIEDSVLQEQPKTEPDKSSEWDKDRQKTEQESANYRKLADKFETASNQQLETMSRLQEQITSVTEQLTSIGKKDTEKLPELDPELVDGNVIRHIATLQKTLAGAEKRLADAEGKIATYEKTESEKAAETRKKSTVDKILKPLDDEFGAKYRQQAIKLADKLINDGDEEQPKDALEASQLMRKCYRQLKETPQTKKSVTVDSGAATVAAEKTERKDGKLEDVWETMKKEGKYK